MPQIPEVFRDDDSKNRYFVELERILVEMFGGDQQVVGNLEVGGALIVFGDSTLTGDVSVGGDLTVTGELIINGLTVNTTRVTSSPYTILSSDNTIVADTDGGDLTINLPPGVDGKTYTIKNVGTSGNVVTLHPNGADLLIGLNEDYVILDRGDDEEITYETTEGWT